MAIGLPKTMIALCALALLVPPGLSTMPAEAARCTIPTVPAGATIQDALLGLDLESMLGCGGAGRAAIAQTLFDAVVAPSLAAPTAQAVHAMGVGVELHQQDTATGSDGGEAHEYAWVEERGEGGIIVAGAWQPPCSFLTVLGGIDHRDVDARVDWQTTQVWIEECPAPFVGAAIDLTIDFASLSEPNPPTCASSPVARAVDPRWNGPFDHWKAGYPWGNGMCV